MDNTKLLRSRFKRRITALRKPSVSQILRDAYRIYFWNKATRQSVRRVLR
jgi:hypothetical protein